MSSASLILPAAQMQPLLLGTMAATAFAPHLQPADLPSLLGSQRLLYCGEYHEDRAGRHALIRAIPRFAELGVTHLAVEYFGAHPDTQAGLDRCFEDPTNANLTPLRHWLHHFGKQYQCAPDLERLIVTAMRSGMRIVGIDDASMGDGRYLANATMTQTLHTIMVDDTAAKCVVLSGAFHVGHHPWARPRTPVNILSVNTMLRNRGYDGIVVHMTGGMLSEMPDHEIGMGNKALLALGASVGRSAEHFLLHVAPPTYDDCTWLRQMQLDEGKDIGWPDYYLHTPQGPRDTPWQLGLADDAYWADRWHAFDTRWYEDYARGSG